MKRTSASLDAVLNDTSLHDVDFIFPACNNEEVSGVSALLAARCQYFRALFNGQWSEGRQDTSKNKRRRVTLGEVSAVPFRHLLHFLYLDELHPDLRVDYESAGAFFDRAFQLWKLADLYGVSDINAELCKRVTELVAKVPVLTILHLIRDNADVEVLCQAVKFDMIAAVKKNIKTQDIVEAVGVVEAYKREGRAASPVMDRVIEACQECLYIHGAKFFRSLHANNAAWIGCTFEVVKQVCGFKLDNNHENYLFKAIQCWWRHDPINRLALAKRAIADELIRLPLVDACTFEEHEESAELISEADALRYYKFQASHFKHSVYPLVAKKYYSHTHTFAYLHACIQLWVELKQAEDYVAVWLRLQKCDRDQLPNFSAVAYLDREEIPLTSKSTLTKGKHLYWKLATTPRAKHSITVFFAPYYTD